MLTGSLAAASNATPRATRDVDAVIETDAAGIERIVEGFLHAGCYIDREAALDHAYVERWISTLGLESEWETVQQRLGRS